MTTKINTIWISWLEGMEISEVKWVKWVETHVKIAAKNLSYVLIDDGQNVCFFDNDVNKRPRKICLSKHSEEIWAVLLYLVEQDTSWWTPTVN